MADDQPGAAHGVAPSAADPADQTRHTATVDPADQTRHTATVAILSGPARHVRASFPVFRPPAGLSSPNRLEPNRLPYSVLPITVTVATKVVKDLEWRRRGRIRAR
jgi:hypothetical protein